MNTNPLRRAAQRPTSGRRRRLRAGSDIAAAPRVDPAGPRLRRPPGGTAPAAPPRVGIEVLVHIRLAPTTLPEVFDRYQRTEPAILHAWRLAGDIDFELHLRCRDLSDLHALLGRARRVGGAWETTTHLILSAADLCPQRPNDAPER